VYCFDLDVESVPLSRWLGLSLPSSAWVLDIRKIVLLNFLRFGLSLPSSAWVLDIREIVLLNFLRLGLHI
jgi:hypothetical protein